MDYTAMTAYASVAGAVGGIIAGIALIVTLIYIARDLRHNAQATHAAMYQANVANTIAILTPIVTNPEVAASALQGLNDTSQGSEVDQFRQHCARLMTVRHYDNLLYQYNLGTLEKSQWDGYAHTLDSWLQRPGYRGWFEKNGHFFSDELRAWVDARLAAMRLKP